MTFLFTLRSAETMEVDAATLTVPDDGTVEVGFVLDPGAWFAGITGASLDVDGGVAVIDPEHNEEVYDLLSDRIEDTEGEWDPEDPLDTGDTGDTGFDDRR